jgi:hypothetical protein
VREDDEEGHISPRLSGLYKSEVNMAQQVRELKISWENGEEFKMETQLDGGGWMTIVEMEENGCISTLWDNGVESACKAFFNTTIQNIGAEMKA